MQIIYSIKEICVIMSNIFAELISPPKNILHNISTYSHPDFPISLSPIVNFPLSSLYRIM